MKASCGGLEGSASFGASYQMAGTWNHTMCIVQVSGAVREKALSLTFEAGLTLGYHSGLFWRSISTVSYSAPEAARAILAR